MVIKLVLLIFLACFSICICSLDESSPSDQYSQNSYEVSPKRDGTALLPCTERYVAAAYFRDYDSLVDSNFQEFVRDKIPVGSGETFLELLNLERHLIGEGSHRRLSSSMRFSIQLDAMLTFSSQQCEVIIIERLPAGVFADPFELEHLLYRGVFKDASVFGDVNLELPSFRSNRSVVEVHLDATVNNLQGLEIIQEFKVEIPLHARYSPLEDSGYSNVKFDVPDLLMRCKMPGEPPSPSCSITPIISIVNLKYDHVVWNIPAGMKAHARIVSVVTFATALLSAVSIIIVSFKHSCSETNERLKRA